MDIKKRQKHISRASWISVVGNAFLSVAKIIVGLLAGSLAVVADGIDSFGDVFASLITLFTAKIITRPPNRRHPYGYDKADTVASKLVAFVIFFAGAQLAISTIQRLIEGGQSELSSPIAIWVVLVSIVGKQLLSRYLRRIGKNVDSPMLRANARNMENDVIISISVLVGLVLTHVLKMPVLDSITALAVSIWIIIVAIRLIITSSRELMDGVDDPTIYKTISEAVAKVPEVRNPHRIRARKMAHYYMIALDVEVDGRISLNEGHKLGHHVEDQIRLAIPSTYDVVVHVEPSGDNNPGEAYGISGKDV
ncbi:MAG: cation diffusion facilitator family transporter [Bacteroidales bacterium]|nr:cation diffusion facilitator family transporter [Bacteroidales bacterium]